MKKLKLNLNELKVESFSPNRSCGSKGTINGNEKTKPFDNCNPTATPECSFEWCDDFETPYCTLRPKIGC